MMTCCIVLTKETVVAEADDFQRMLDASAKIAEAVKAYPPDLQRAVYDDLMSAARGTPPIERRAGTDSTQDGPRRSGTTRHVEDVDEEKPDSAGTRGRSRRPTKTAATRKARPKQVAAVRDYNFWPKGKDSFPAFAEEKQPPSNHHKNLLVVYWFDQIAEEAAISVGHVLAAYKVGGWRAPADPDNSLQVTASQKHWLDTSDMKAIKTTHAGRVIVEHELPAAAKPDAGQRKVVKKTVKRIAKKAAAK